jgi:hypothetical protein
MRSMTNASLKHGHLILGDRVRCISADVDVAIFRPGELTGAVREVVGACLIEPEIR